MNSFIGYGYDVHQLVTGRKLILGGVDIPFEKGLKGHSDGDVLTHALIDALLGGGCLGDIGEHFPDSDPQYRGISSLVLLGKVKELLDKRGLAVGNIDIVVVAEEPRIAKHKEQMRRNLAKVLALGSETINIKAKTGERLGFVGRGEGISAHAVASLIRRNA